MEKLRERGWDSEEEETKKPIKSPLKSEKIEV